MHTTYTSRQDNKIQLHKRQSKKVSLQSIFEDVEGGGQGNLLWELVSTLTTTDQDSINTRLHTLPNDLSSAPIFHIINVSVSNRNISYDRETTQVSLLYKNGSINENLNHCSIFVSPVMNMMLARVVHGQFPSIFKAIICILRSKQAPRKGS